MDEITFTGELLKGSLPMVQRTLLFVAPAIIVISLVMDFCRSAVAFVWPFWKSRPEDASMAGAARRLFLFTSPLALGCIWLWGISGTWLLNGVRLNVKEWTLAGLLLGVLNTAFYRYLWKPYGRPWVTARLARLVPGAAKPPAAGG